MRGGFVSPRLSLASTLLSFSVFSLAHISPPSAAALLILHPFSPMPLPLSTSVSLAFPHLSRSRVLLTRTRFSSPLSSIRAPGYTTDSHPPPPTAGLPEEAEARGVRDIEVNARGTLRGQGRTGPTHRSRDIHFHFIFLARYQR